MAFPVSDAEHAAIKARIAELPELIVAAAVRVDGPQFTLPVVLLSERPGRHGNVIWAAGALSGDRLHGGEHGFLTSHGRFVGRIEAAALVVATGQGSTRDFGPEYPRSLFSEDMWNDWDVSPRTPIRPEDVFGAHAESNAPPADLILENASVSEASELQNPTPKDGGAA